MIYTIHKSKTVRIKSGWLGAGKLGVTLGPSIVVSGVSWTPVLWENNEDPDFQKTVSLAPANLKDIYKAKGCSECGGGSKFVAAGSSDIAYSRACSMCDKSFETAPPQKRGREKQGRKKKRRK